jgi:hypothetical protein
VTWHAAVGAVLWCNVRRGIAVACFSAEPMSRATLDLSKQRFDHRYVPPLGGVMNLAAEAGNNPSQYEQRSDNGAAARSREIKEPAEETVHIDV